MPIISVPRLLIIAAFLSACLVPLSGAFASSGAYSFIITKALGVRSANELDGATVCLVTNSGMESEVQRYFKKQGISFEPVTANTKFKAVSSYQNGVCDVLVDDELTAATTLAGLKASHKHMILPDTIGSASATTSPPAQPAAPSTAAPVAPSCPAGYGFSNGKCLKLAAPTPPPVRRETPRCPAGYAFSNGNCMKLAAPRPAPVNLALELQKELKRIGCYTGGLDGDWGHGSQSALKRFSSQAGLRLGTSPSQQAIDEARRTAVGYCQPVRVAPKRTAPKRKKTTGCRSGTVWLEGQCIPRSQVAEFCGPGFEWRGGSKCVPMSGGGQQAGGGCLSKCESRLKACQGNINRSEDEIICMNKFDSCSQSC